MRKQPPGWVLGLMAAIGVIIVGWVDWLTGYEVSLSALYFIPVAVGTWFLGIMASIVLAVLSAMVWFAADFFSGHVHPSHAHAVWNTLVRLATFAAIGLSMDRIRQLMDQQRETASHLRPALSEIRVLESFLTICCQCSVSACFLPAPCCCFPAPRRRWTADWPRCGILCRCRCWKFPIF